MSYSLFGETNEAFERRGREKESEKEEGEQSSRSTGENRLGSSPDVRNHYRALARHGEYTLAAQKLQISGRSERLPVIVLPNEGFYRPTDVFITFKRHYYLCFQVFAEWLVAKFIGSV